MDVSGKPINLTENFFRQRFNGFLAASILFFCMLLSFDLSANEVPARQCFYDGTALQTCEEDKKDWSDYRCHLSIEPETGYRRWNYYYRQLPPFYVECPEPCQFPFTREPGGNKCIKKCPPYQPQLNLDMGQCVAEEEKRVPTKLCKGNPVLISSGEKVQVEPTDYQSYGPLALYFQRDYQSYRSEEADIFWQAESSGIALDYSVINTKQWVIYEQPQDYVPSLWVRIPQPWAAVAGSGSNDLQPPVAGHRQWRHNYQSRLMVTSSRLILDTPSGFKVFRPEGENYVSTALTQEIIEPITFDDGSSGWRYVRSPDYRETYNSLGQLVRISQSDSIYQTLTYHSEGQLESVSHSLGGSLQLAYNSEGQLSQLTTPDNQIVVYRYDSRGNLSQVETSYSDGQSRSRYYHYEDDKHPYALTGITDEKGIRYASWTYNEQGQAIESVHADGADKITFVFNGDVSTSVTSPLNKTTIYHYDNQSGMKRLSSVEGVATVNCAAANQAYRYYDNGLLQSKTDWQGNTTTYTYNDQYQEISRTEAAGTEVARTVTTQWHETLNLPVQVSEPNRIITYHYNAEGKLLNKTIVPMNGQ